MKLCVVGTGYVGLVTGACFAEMGNTVTCVDVDAKKVENLKRGVLPIYEPGLDVIVANNYKAGRLRFTTTLPDALRDAAVCFIAVGTPPKQDGSADLSYVFNVAREIGEHLDHYVVVVGKSTVPVGTAEQVRAIVDEQLAKRSARVEFDVASNPEFLKEGDAVNDFMRPDRVIVGCESERARELMHKLYSPFMRNHERILYMGVRDAELSKYASNAMLATKISFMNEVANLCERLGVDVENVRNGIGADSRIGYSFIYPGCGFGGSCFPKDIRAMIHMAESQGMTPAVLRAVDARNQEQKRVLFQKVTRRFGRDLSSCVFGLWGLAFKPGTDDMREAPAIALLEDVLAAGAKVKAYDPVAMENARRELPREWFADGRLELVEHQYDAVKGVDALVLVTEWKPFRYPDFEAMKKMMKTPVIFDGRNQYNPRELRDAGFDYQGIGR